MDALWLLKSNRVMYEEPLYIVILLAEKNRKLQNNILSSIAHKKLMKIFQKQ